MEAVGRTEEGEGEAAACVPLPLSSASLAVAVSQLYTMHEGKMYQGTRK